MINGINLIRTVTHEYDSGDESVLNVSTIHFNGPALEPSITLDAEEGRGGVMIHSEAQARELFRAIRAAGKRLDWFEEE